MRTGTIVDGLLATYLAPALGVEGFRRSGRRFKMVRSDAVGVVAVQVSRDSPRFTIRAAIAYRQWAEFLHASASLKDPLMRGDRNVSATDQNSPFPGAEKWWDLDSCDLERVGAEARDVLCNQVLPKVLSLMSPEADRDALLARFGEPRFPADVLPRLYFWLVWLEPRAPAAAVAAVRASAIRAGKEGIIRRVDNWEGTDRVR